MQRSAALLVGLLVLVGLAAGWLLFGGAGQRAAGGSADTAVTPIAFLEGRPTQRSTTMELSELPSFGASATDATGANQRGARQGSPDGTGAGTGAPGAPGTSGGPSSKWLAQRPSELAEGQAFLDGRVVVQGIPVEGALLTLIGRAGSPEAGPDDAAPQEAAGRLTGTTTLADGSFGLSIDVERCAGLIVEAPGTFPAEVAAGYLRDGDWYSLGEIDLTPAAPLQLVVQDLTGEVRSDAWAYAINRSNRGLDLGRHQERALEKAEGGLVVPRFPRNGWIVCGAPGLRSQSFQVSPEVEQPVVLALEQGRRAEVSTRDNHGRAIAGAEVYLFHEGRAGDKLGSYLPGGAQAGRVGYHLGSTDAEGLARFAELGPDGYIAIARHPDHLDSSGGYVTPEGSEGALVELSLERRPRLTVRLAGQDLGGPPPGLRVAALDPAARTWVEAHADADGLVDLPLPHRGAWLLEAWAPGHHLISQPIDTERAADEADPASVSVQTLVRAKGRLLALRDPSGALVEGGWVEVEFLSRARRDAAPPDTQVWGQSLSGEALAGFRLERPWGAEWIRGRAGAEGHVAIEWDPLSWPRVGEAPSSTAPTEPGADDLPLAPFELPLALGFDLEVTALDAAGNPVADARVYLTRDGKGSTDAPRTDSSGYLRYDDLGEGVVSLKAKAPDGALSDRVEIQLGTAANHPEGAAAQVTLTF